MRGWITDGALPDDDIRVLIRTIVDDDPLVMGFHDNGSWWMDGTEAPILPIHVHGWMHVEDAARILDASGKTTPAEKEVSA